MHYRRIGSFAASLALAATSLANFAPDVEKISSLNLESHLGFIAHDLMGGRDTPSFGLDVSAQYIAAQLKMYGVQPGGVNGTYFQPMEYARRRLNASTSSFSIDGKNYEAGKDYIPTSLEAIDFQNVETVFVPSGWTNADRNLNPFNGFDVKGKVVLTDATLPEGVVMRDTFRDAKWVNPQNSAMKQGAVAVIVISATESNPQWARQLERLTGEPRYALATNTQASIPAIQVTQELGNFLKSVSLNASRAEFTSPAPKVSLKLDVQTEKTTASNVIGIIPGSDPTLKNEYVALGAHYDHVGIGRPDATGDTIYNGADDDGSGTVAMIEIARVLSSGNRPKRSTLFVWHCGEEKGLVGSRFFANNPTINLKNLIIQINMDMIGMAKQPGDTNPANKELTESDEIYVIGPKLISTDITRTLTAVNSATVKMRLNEKYDTTSDPNQFYQRSDHYSYIEKGVPAIFLFSGAHAHYHQASDEIERIDFNKLTMTTKLLYGLAYEFANQPDKPRVDGPLKSLFGGLQ